MLETPRQDEIGHIASSTQLRIRDVPTPGVRYISGSTIYDETLIEGRLVDRYWASDGYIKPEDERILRWPTHELHTFDLEIDGQALDGYWQWAGAREEPATDRGTRHGVIRLAHTVRPVSVEVHMLLDGTPVMTRWLEITNTGEQAAALTSVSPWSSLLWATHLPHHLSPPSKEAFTLGWYASNAAYHEGSTFTWQPLANLVTRIQNTQAGSTGYRQPFFIVRNEATGEYFIGHLAWSANWFFDFHCEQDPAPFGGNNPERAFLFFRGGPQGPHAPQRIIAPGETVSTPEMHLGHLKGDLDACVQAMHTHVRRSVIPPRPKGKQFLVQYNPGGGGFGYWRGVWKRDPTQGEAQQLREVDIAADLGCEHFTLDSGWNGQVPGAATPHDHAVLNAGDWHPNQQQYPQGLKPLREQVRAKSMTFGLWVEPETIGPGAPMFEEHPDWLLHREGELLKPDHAQLDLTKPEVVAWLEAEISRIIEDYDLDMFRLDYNVGDLEEGGHTSREGWIENTHWRYCQAWYAILERIRAKYPHVILQQCAGGGGRNDLGMVGQWHENYLTDGHWAPQLALCLNGMTLALPPDVFASASPIFHYRDGARDLDGQLRTSMIMLPPMIGGVAPSLDDLTPQRRERFRHYVDLYKRFVRPMLATCRVFHHAPITAHEVRDDWLALEYAAADSSRAVAMVYRLKGATEDAYHFVPRGLDISKAYRVTFDNTGSSATLSGMELQQSGLRARVEQVFASELLLFEAVS